MFDSSAILSSFRRLLSVSLFALLGAAAAVSADDPPPVFFGQIHYLHCYQDNTYSGIFFTCEHNTCTGEEVCPLPKTDYCIEESQPTTITCNGGPWWGGSVS
jgi:hypothetical protein